MSEYLPKTLSAIATATAAVSAAAAQSGSKSPQELLDKITTTDEAVSAPACDVAAEYGAAMVPPLAKKMADPDFELARRCKRALLKVVRHAGRPGAKKEAAEVEGQLILLLISDNMLPVSTRRALLWMLSEIGTRKAVASVAALLGDTNLREDARCVLIRIPGKESLAALQNGLKTAPEDFKCAMADALRSRGEKVTGYPSKKLLATAQTTVKPKT